MKDINNYIGNTVFENSQFVLSGDLLLDKGFKFNGTAYELKSRGTDYDYYITITNTETNSIDRNWTCHIDNNRHESVGYADVDNIAQVNGLLGVFGIRFRF